jgi:spore maturation protein CgeB
MKILCVFGEHAYGDPARGFSYEFSNFLPALRRMGNEVELFESFDRGIYQNSYDLNKSLIDRVAKLKPDLIFFVIVNYEIWRETLLLVRKSTPCITVCWSTDDSWKFKPVSQHIADCFDFYVTTYGDAMRHAKSIGLTNFRKSQWAADSSSLLEPVCHRDCDFEVTFVGAAYGNRKRRVIELKERGVEVQCFGYGWPSGPISNDFMREVFRKSFINLSFDDSPKVIGGLSWRYDRQIKARNFEVLGHGGFLLTDALPELDEYLEPGKDFVRFEGIDELAEKIEFYRKYPESRDDVALSGHSCVRMAHTYENRFEPLLKEVCLLREQRIHLDTDFSMNLAAVMASDQSTSWQRLIEMLFVCIGRIFGGRAKARKVARRIIFELSWRVCGQQTFTSNSIVSRLFFHD